MKVMGIVSGCGMRRSPKTTLSNNHCFIRRLTYDRLLCAVNFYKMTPEEKAKELVSSFTYKCTECDYIENAKTSALLCCVEVMKYTKSTIFTGKNRISDREYWEKVKEAVHRI